MNVKKNPLLSNPDPTPSSLSPLSLCLVLLWPPFRDLPPAQLHRSLLFSPIGSSLLEALMIVHV
ncbi:hypothetical protein V2J09_021437 [Rumex salicifolius]